VKEFPKGVDDSNKNEYEAWRMKNPRGFIVNAIRSPRTRMWTLHTAGCHMVQYKMHTPPKEKRKPKICCENVNEVAQVIAANKGAPFLPLASCYKCRNKLGEARKLVKP